MHMRQPVITFDQAIEIENKDQVVKDVVMVCRSNGIKPPELAPNKDGSFSFIFDSEQNRNSVARQLAPIYGRAKGLKE